VGGPKHKNIGGKRKVETGHPGWKKQRGGGQTPGKKRGNHEKDKSIWKKNGTVGTQTAWVTFHWWGKKGPKQLRKGGKKKDWGKETRTQVSWCRQTRVGQKNRKKGTRGGKKMGGNTNLPEGVNQVTQEKDKIQYRRKKQEKKKTNKKSNRTHRLAAQRGKKTPRGKKKQKGEEKGAEGAGSNAQRREGKSKRAKLGRSTDAKDSANHPGHGQGPDLWGTGKSLRPTETGKNGERDQVKKEQVKQK